MNNNYSSEKVKGSTGSIQIPKKAWVQKKAEVLQYLQVSPVRGLEQSVAKKRLEEFGPNLLRATKKRSAWSIFVDQFKSLIVILLAVASGLSFLFGETLEGVAIAVVVIINAVIGFWTELRAVRSMEALKQLGRVSAKVRRDGAIKEISAQEIVPGDIVVLEGGDIVSADLRLFQASKLQADESTLTGESLPVSKDVDVLGDDVPLAERKNMLFKGTAITRGSAEGVVVCTGMKTELGRISALVEEAEEEITPLERRLDQLGHRLIWVTLAIAVMLSVIGIVVGKDLFLMIETSIALAVAAIPEGLPIVATIALARGMWRMARRNALINRLSAVETLGATDVIFTDKTGTLTENRMTVTRFILDSGIFEISTDGKFIKDGKNIKPQSYETLYTALKVGLLCNNASLPKDGNDEESKAVGDPLEIALLRAGANAGLTREQLIEQLPEQREEAFDPETRKMATFHNKDGAYLVAVKGAPEAVLEVSKSVMTEGEIRDLDQEQRKEWQEKNRLLAEQGLRTLGLALNDVATTKVNPYQELVFLGVVGMEDPSRQDVGQAIDSCKHAGIRVIMVTGDQPVTALNIGSKVGLVEKDQPVVMHGKDLIDKDSLSNQDREELLKAAIFARVTPRQKLDLIDVHQKAGSIVAMTGDGVNDAPALKEADIGVAMGMRGTQVAREAADMVLKDDAFSTIVAAVEEGRIIFNNIRKFALYLLSCNVSEIMVVALATIFNAPLPILPLQILFLNLITDVFPALALGVGRGDPSVMDCPPRDKDEPILVRENWLAIGGYGVIITASVLAALWLAISHLGMGERQAVTVSFLTLAFAQLWHVFNMRHHNSNILKNDITKNPFLWGSLVLCSGLLVLAVYLPGLSTVLKVVNPGTDGWFIILGLSLIPLFIGQLFKLIKAFD